MSKKIKLTREQKIALSRRKTEIMIARGKRRISNGFFAVYQQTQKGVRRFTNPLVKTAIRAERKLRPYTDESLIKANTWIDNNVKQPIGKMLYKPQKIATKIKNVYVRKKKK